MFKKINFLTIILVCAALSCCKIKHESKSEELLRKENVQLSSETRSTNVLNGPKKEVKSACNCFNGIGSSENDSPIFTSTFSNGESLVICGFHDEEIQQEILLMSEFNIFNCETGEAIAEYGALQICSIEERKDVIIIKELKYLPVGSSWKWELTQIGKQEVILNNGEIITTNQVPEIGQINISELDQSTFLSSLVEGQGFGLEWESDISKLEVLSIIGNKKAWKILQNYEDFTGDKTDGALAEHWKDATANVEWIIGN